MVRFKPIEKLWSVVNTVDVRLMLQYIATVSRRPITFLRGSAAQAITMICPSESLGALLYRRSMSCNRTKQRQAALEVFGLRDESALRFRFKLREERRKIQPRLLPQRFHVNTAASAEQIGEVRVRHSVSRDGAILSACGAVRVF